MAEVEVQQGDALPEEVLEDLVKYKDVLLENEEEIKQVFEKTVSTDKKFNNIDKTTEFLELTLTPEIEDEDLDLMLNHIISMIINYDSNTRDRFHEEGEEELARLFSNLKLEYGIDLEQRINRLWKGNDWWSNIKTNIGSRSNNVYFQHELTLDFDREFEFNTNLNSSLILINHFLRQIHSAKNLHGVDILRSIPISEVEELIENSDDLLNEIQEYYEDLDEDIKIEELDVGKTGAAEDQVDENNASGSSE